MQQELVDAAMGLCKGVHYGPGKLSVLGETLEGLNGEALVFVDQNGFGPCGAEAYMEGLGEDLKKKFTIVQFAGKALPLECVEELYEGVKEKANVKLVVAIGGGTVMDLAKCIAVALSTKAASVDDVVEKKATGNTIDLLFVPTTAGTGSEATTFAVVYKNKVKRSVDEPALLPGSVILDENLIKSLPKPVLYTTVLDALAHSTESTWARGGTDESREYGQMAIRCILTHTLSGYQLGSHLAGKAINISRTTLSHAMSYFMSAHHGVPHGTACFLTLPYVAEFNYKATEATLSPGYTMEMLEMAFKKLFSAYGVDTVKGMQGVLFGFMEKFGISPDLASYGVTDVETLAANSITPGRSDNNPRQASVEDCAMILREVLVKSAPNGF
eukprot:TRINITY_DN9291_c2_g2_i1.p1 TRINITY_DN9291_c2_g2~~TRINITY_DN9291_c2_g2_i1.p1  ORF type:complete len:401 (+),score=100.88 TRINITY_DN9291_c2_g2_i1:48-1205(+)